MGTFPTNKSLVNQGLHSWGVVCGACVSPVCVHVWSPVCVHVDARGHCPLSSSVVFYLIFLRQSFTGLGLLAWLDFGSVGWPVSSEDHLSLPSEGYHRTQIFACFWGIQTQLLTLTLHLPNHPRSVAHTHTFESGPCSVTSSSLCSPGLLASFQLSCLRLLGLQA